MSTLVYFSSQSNNTHRFVLRTGLPALRIPLDSGQRLRVDEPYILVVPSYGGGTARGAVPKQVIQFLNDASNRQQIRGVIAAGNRNFGEAYCLAGSIIAQKCQVPCLYRFELLGTSDDIANVTQGVTEFWLRQKVHS
ncbi:class Ib ribonucleoside-diphosphate reductase assembly flavoprotein NrdI [Erwinia endophytica]|uniref:class Ib ribonucleoside-diphosphate reductase assembly flavoprotein NrdI n=1 Tax=Erwinia endophytica TaxID=1563158 RepID=UPI001265DF81|nr:class Ib ribonucleoside-diphosphate reductase assembly flavoprotein NrdI [Erwinia endophytica]KAB8308305.1 class Ib ribonucleoside-diphosphate reductase assembly flavoprotein NrdI [Erwinia endophytica]